MAVSNQVNALTNKKIAKGIADNVLGDNFTFAQFMARAKKPSTGKQWEKTIKHQKSTQGGSYRGADTFSTNVEDNFILLTEDYSFYEQPVVLNGTDVALNELTGGKAHDLKNTNIESQMQDLADLMGGHFFASQADSKDILGLEAIIDDGTNAATIHNQSRTTYSVLNATRTDSSGTISLAKFRTLVNACSVGVHQPDLYPTTRAVYGYYEQLLQPQERIYKMADETGKKLIGGTGFSTLMYDGAPLLKDDKCTSGSLYAVNLKSMDIQACPNTSLGKKVVPFKATFEGSPYSEVTGLGFSWSDWIKTENSDQAVAHIYWMGQLTCSNFRFNGVLHSITGV
jgi:hypothetical protein